MISWFNSFLLNFVPLFVVIDTTGVLPVIVSLSEGLTGTQRVRMIRVSTITATAVGFVFLFLGKLILELLGISVGSFAIAVVPIGTPLTVGPATITALLLLPHGSPYTLCYLPSVSICSLLTGFSLPERGLPAFWDAGG